MRWGFLVFGPSALCAPLLVTGCASGPAPAPDLDRGFARIQQHEAEISRAELALRSPDATCERSRSAGAAARDSAAALCQLARELGDPDALTRCERAERAAQSVTAQAELRCSGSKATPEAAPGVE
jgi:hypothetical protein